MSQGNWQHAAASKRSAADMERVNRIWRHPLYQSCLERIRSHEETREFCRHTPEHFLDVARLTYLLALEAGMNAEGLRGQIYAAALLHDIGRHLQYEQGIPHEKASAEIAEEILRDCGYGEDEREAVLGLIRAHRTRREDGSLAALFYRADKLSRNCFACAAEKSCDWPAEKKNLELRY